MSKNETKRCRKDLPDFLTFGELTYDINEVDHRQFMRDHRAVGCIALLCTKPLDTSCIGIAFLNGQRLPDCFCCIVETPDHGNLTYVCIPVKGYAVDYASLYTLRLEGFFDIYGNELSVFETSLRTLPRGTNDTRYAAHDTIALQAAREGMVLLRNEDHVLPLNTHSTLNLFGSGVVNYRLAPVGAGRIKPRAARSLMEAVYETSDFAVNTELTELYRDGNDHVPNHAVLERAKAQSDVAVIILTRGTSESLDNRAIAGEYYLTAGEDAMLRAVREVFEKIVVVLNTGYPIEMKWMERYQIKAVIYAGLAGQSGAEALLEILDGRTNPSGKLTDTWAWDYHDIPSSKNFLDANLNGETITGDKAIWAQTCYEEGIYIGYRYFETFQKDTAFCFGYGLSYTSFSIDAGKPLETANRIDISVNVKNIGNRAGKEVVQVYAKLPGTLQEQPARQLAAFCKTKLLQPGEQETVYLSFPVNRFSTYVESRNAWIREEGIVNLYVGSDLKGAILCGSIRQSEEVLHQLKYRIPCPIKFTDMSVTGKKCPTGTQTKYLPEACGLSNTIDYSYSDLSEDTEFREESVITFSMIQEQPDRTEDFIAQMKTEELVRLNVLYSEEWTMDANGVAGKLAPLEPYGIPDYRCADGNNSLLIGTPNIGMPCSTVMCSTFSTELCRAAAQALGGEAYDNNIRLMLAPGMNLHRNPLCGRHSEYFSEDPILTGIMAAAYVDGLHRAGISDCIKHIACNNCETVRKRNNSLVNERALRELYLRSFEVLLEETESDSMMTAYNALNGYMCGENPVLLEGVFREELGFNGFVMTDWNSYETIDMTAAVKAGVSWLTPGETDGHLTEKLIAAVKEGKISRSELERNAERVIRIMLKRFKRRQKFE